MTPKEITKALRDLAAEIESSDKIPPVTAAMTTACLLAVNSNRRSSSLKDLIENTLEDISANTGVYFFGCRGYGMSGWLYFGHPDRQDSENDKILWQAEEDIDGLYRLAHIMTAR